MKRRSLIHAIQEMATVKGLPWARIREGSRHEVWRCGTTVVSIPRHREINELTALGIFRDLEQELGVRWWQ
jgi:mRNA interferase HicA